MKYCVFAIVSRMGLKYQITTGPGLRAGQSVTSKSIRETEAFFKNLVTVTDKGMKEHIRLTYGITGIWS